MRRQALLAAIAGFTLLLHASLPLPAQSSNELKLGSASVGPGAVASIPLTLSSTDEVQGLAAAFEWDGAVGTGDNLVAGAAVASADVLVSRVDARFMVFGVVIDNNGAGPSFIPPGTGLSVATVKIRAPATVNAEKTTDLQFVDNKYASVAGGPLLENLVTVGGLSITADKGLKLTKGSLTVGPMAPTFAFKMVNSSSSETSDCGAVQILMDSNAPAEGYEIAIAHPDALRIDKIDVGGAATTNGADFSQTDIVAGGGTLGVVMDLQAPFQNNTIPGGQDLEIAVFKFCCKSRPQSQAQVYDLTFVDGILGSPPKSNNVVVNGVAYGPVLQHGKFTCTVPPDREICDNGKDDDGDGKIDCADPDCANFEKCGPENTEERCDDDFDNDGDGKVDCADPDCASFCGAPGAAFSCGSAADPGAGAPLPAEGTIGKTATVCFYYRSPTDAIQGLSMAVCSPCDAGAKEGTFSIVGTIVEALAADYVVHESDVDPADGDGCELIIGILLESKPPFEGTTLPTTEDYLKIGCIQYEIANKTSLCGQCLDVTFCDGINGRGKVPIQNLISVANQSKSPQLVNCQICVKGQGIFHRGDCNYSNVGALSVDISDPAATVSFLLGQGALKFDAPCLDACDSNDDGRVDLADVVYTLKFLFQFGSFPPAPGPGFNESGQDTPPGTDPTPDNLGCAASDGCQ